MTMKIERVMKFKIELRINIKIKIKIITKSKGCYGHRIKKI